MRRHYQLNNISALGMLRGIAKDPLGLRIPIGDPAMLIEINDTIQRSIENLS